MADPEKSRSEEDRDDELASEPLDDASETRPPGSNDSTGETEGGDIDHWLHLMRHDRSDSGSGLPAKLAERLARESESESADSSLKAMIRFPEPPAKDGDIGCLDSYEIEERLGEGGFGVVYRAFDTELNRPVAIKILKPQHAADPVHCERFEREARAASDLRSDHVVTIHRVGAATAEFPQPWFVMELIDGPSLRDLRNSRWQEDSGNEQALPVPRVIEFARDVATGLVTAHEAGLVHRDIKPANILIDAATGRAKITDFGLARDLESDAESLSGGKLAGAPAYMSPEQIQSPQKIDQRSDIYAMGVLLYELVTGTRPFRGSGQALLLQIVAGDPVSPRRLNPEISRDLETVILKCLENQPAQRYASARELADDLDRLSRQLPVSARPIGTVERYWRWSHRNPRLAGMTIAFVVAFTGGAAASIAFGFAANAEKRRANSNFTQMQNERNAAVIARGQANAEKTKAEAARDHATLMQTRAEEATKVATRAKAQAQAERDRERDRTVRLSIANGRRAAGDADYLAALPSFAAAFQRDKEAYRTRQKLHRMRIGTALRQVPRLENTIFADGPVYYGEFSPDGSKVVLLVASKHYARIWDLNAGRFVSPEIRMGAPLTVAHFSRDGKKLLVGASSLNGSRLGIFQASDGKPLTESVNLPGMMWNATFNPDATRVAVPLAIEGLFGSTGYVQVLDEELKKIPHRQMGAAGWMVDAAFSPDGQTLAACSQKGFVGVWNPETGEPVFKLADFKLPLCHIAFNPQGTRIVATSNYGAARVWDAQTGEPVTPKLFHADVFSGPTGNSGRGLAQSVFSPDGKSVATSCGDNTVRVWSVPDGTPMAQPIRHDHTVTAIGFDPAGDVLLSASLDRSVKLTHPRFGDAVVSPIKHSDGIVYARFSPDGSRILTVSRDMTARIWSFERPAKLSPPLKRGVALPAFGAFAAFNHDGSLVLTADDKGKAVVWNATTDKPATEVFQHRGRISHAVFTHDGKRVVLATGLLQPQGQFSVWDLTQTPPAQTGESVRVSWPITVVKLTPDEKHVLVAGGTAQQMSASGARVFELGTLAEVGSPHTQFLQVLHADISPNGSLYATASPDGNVFVRELLTGRLVQRLIHSLNTQTVRFSPDGKRVVTTSDDSAVVWDLASGKRIGSALQHGEMVNYAEFSPDGESLATASSDQTAQIWVWDSDADDWTQTGETIRHGSDVLKAVFSPDGDLLATATDQYIAQVWDARTGEMVSPPLKHRGSQIFDVRFSGADPVRLLTLNLLRLWTWELPEAEGTPAELLAEAEWQSGQKASEVGDFVPVTLTESELITRQIERRPGQWPLYLKRAQLAASRQEWDAVISDCQLITGKLQEAPAEVYSLWATALAGQKKYSQAIEQLTLSRKLGNSSSWLLAQRAQYSSKAGDFDAAIVDMDEFLKQQTWSGYHFLVRGWMHASLQDWDQAEADYERGIKLGTKGLGEGVDTVFHFQRALLDIGRKKNADYRNAVPGIVEAATQRTDGESWFSAAWATVLLPGKENETPESETTVPQLTSVQLAQKALATDPQNAQYRTILGAAYFRQSDHDAASRELNKAEASLSQSEDEDDLAYLGFSRVFLALVESQQQPTQARSWLEKAESQFESQKREPNGPPVSWSRQLIMDTLLDEARSRLAREDD